MDDLSEPAPDPPLPIENGGGVEPVEEPCSKKAKVEEVDSEGELKRVAEIVLVLSTMAAMRGGRKPTDVEVELMTEARNKLTNLCEGLAPKDIVAGEAIGTVIEDLGFNAKIKDQRLGFRTPRMSVAERYSNAKWKMEESKKFSAPSTTYTSQPLQTTTGGMVDHRVPTNAFVSNKSSHTVVSSTGTVVSIPSHLSAGSSAPLQYQPASSEVRLPVVSGVIPSSHLGRNPSSVVALPRVENPQFKVDGGLNGPPYVMQVQANSSANQQVVTAPAWSIQSQSTSLTRSGSENKVPAQNSVKVEGASAVTISRAGPQITMDQNFRPFITQTAPANLPSVHQSLSKPPLIPGHTDIAKIVQKLLQPKLPDHPTWTPPSRDYMNKAFTCQTCELTVNEVDTVLLCDACERGFHMKCLQPSVYKSIYNKVDWHCSRCLSLSGGKLLAPKYGKVMRSSNTSPSFSPSTGGIQLSSEMKARSLDPMVSAQMLITNENSIATVSDANNNLQMSFDSKDLDMRDTQGATNISSSIETIDEKSDPNNCMKSASSSTSTGLPGESSDQQTNSKALTCKETLESETLPKLSEPAKSEDLQLSQVSQVEMPVSLDNAEIPLDRHGGENLISSTQKESHGVENSTYDIKRDNQDVAHVHFVGGSGTNTEGEEHSALSSVSSHAVEWIGDVVCLEDEKKYYQSCCVDGVTYRLQGHALFPSSHGKLTPSKFQSLWEDCKTGIKWVKVTKCYFPDDLPGNIGHPCISEVNEVYESNSEINEMASSIRGSCEVLPYDKFKQENDRRCQFGIEANAKVQPIFLCRWFYDETKSLFQPVTS